MNAGERAHRADFDSVNLCTSKEISIEIHVWGMCVFITAGPIIKLCAGGGGDSEGHVL